MDDIERVINVHTRKISLDAVRRHFERFGNIAQIYPWTSGSARNHFFIEFETAESAKRVKVDNQGDMTFQYLSRNPNMVKRYRALVSGSHTNFQERKRPLDEGNTQRHATNPGGDGTPYYTKKPRLSNNSSTYPRAEITPPYLHRNSGTYAVNLGKPQWSSQRRTSERNSYHLSQTNSPDYLNYISPASGNLIYSTPDNWPSDSPLRLKTAGTGIQPEGAPYTPSDRTFLDPRSAHNDKTVDKDQSQLMIPPSPVSLVDMQSSQYIPSPASSYAAGEYNPSFPLLLPQDVPSPVTSNPCQRTGFSELSRLDHSSKNDAARTIASLKQATSDLGEWMTAAATFRRNGKHADALEIANALLGEMKGRGMKDSDMKPALLLAAQSSHSLALGFNQGNSGDRTDGKATELFLTTIDWLNKAYGNDSAKAEALAMSTGARKRALNYVVGVDKENEAPRAGPACTCGSSQNRSTKKINVDVDTTVHRELNALKAKYSSTLTALQNANTEQRHTKESLNSEYKRQTDLQRQLDDLRQELRRTQGDADALYKQMQRESEARRAAEKRLTQEIEAARRRETELKEEATKLLMQKLAKTFERVAENPSRMRELTNSMAECKEETRNHEF